MVNKRSFGVLFLALLLTGCGHYNSCPLRHVKKKTADFSETKEDVSLYVQKFSYDDLKKCFNGQTSRLVKPLIFTIKNNSDQVVSLPMKNIGLSLVPLEKVYKYLSRSYFDSIAKGIFGGTLLLLCVPVGVAALFCSVSGSYSAILMTGGAFAALLYSASRVLNGLSYEVLTLEGFNSQLKQDLQQKTPDTLMVEPHTKKTTIAFAKNIPHNFQVVLQKDNKNVSFDVLLKE